MKFIMFLLLTVSWTSAYSQATRMEIAVMGAPTVRWLPDINTSFIHKPTLGFASVLSVGYNLDPHLTLSIGAGYELKGSVYELAWRDFGDYTGEIATGGTKFHYMVAPILMKYSIGTSTKFFVQAGAYFSYLSKMTTYADAFRDFPPLSGDNTGDYYPWDYGGLLGLGALIPISARLVANVEARANLGMRNIAMLPGAEIKPRSTGLYLGIGYKLGVSTKEDRQ